MESIKDKLIDRLWKTKKIRMNTEERLINIYNFYQWLIIYYSVFIILLSILALNKSSNWINYALVLSSITITVMSVYISSQNYIQRANNLKNNYTKIAELEIKLELLTGNNLNADNLEEINNQYQELHKQVENHKNIDYINTLQEKTWKYHIHFLKNIAIKVITALIPIIIIIVYFLNIFTNPSA